MCVSDKVCNYVLYTVHCTVCIVDIPLKNKTDKITRIFVVCSVQLYKQVQSLTFKQENNTTEQHVLI